MAHEWPRIAWVVGREQLRALKLCLAALACILGVAAAIQAFVFINGRSDASEPLRGLALPLYFSFPFAVVLIFVSFAGHFPNFW